MAIVKRTGKLEKEIMIGGIVAIVGYFVWKRFFSPKVLDEKKCKNAYENPPGGGSIKMPYSAYRTEFCKLETKKEDCSVGGFNQREMCKQRNNPGYIHAPLQ